MNLISVIVTTYNWPAALTLCLESLFAQNDACFEIIIADDGSTPENLKLSEALCAISPVVIRYVYHEDLGFRAGTIRNKAVAVSQGAYLLFIDGDCVLPQGFIRKHRELAEAGFFVAGNRVLLSQSYTQEAIEQRLALYAKSFGFFLNLRLQNEINRAITLIKLPLGFLRVLQPQKWQKAMTCNLALWKEDFIRVNGFDECFQGWGYEDSDLVIRLIHAGIKRKEGRFAVTVLHLWHPQNDRSHHDLNYQRLMARLQDSDCIRAEQGFSENQLEVDVNYP